MTLLSESEIEEKMVGLPEWRQEGDTIARTYDCQDFVGAVGFVSRMVEPAEEMNHHPDVEISWKNVTARLTTHSQGGLTAADFELAAKLDTLG